VRLSVGLGLAVDEVACEMEVVALADARKLYFEGHSDLSKDIDDARIRNRFGDTDGQCVPNGSLGDTDLRIVA
jgi:hypothetical protein